MLRGLARLRHGSLTAYRLQHNKYPGSKDFRCVFPGFPSDVLQRHTFLQWRDRNGF